MSAPASAYRNHSGVARARASGLPRMPRAYAPPQAIRDLVAEPLPPLLVLQAPRAFGKSVAVSWLLREQQDERQEVVWVNLPHRRVEPSELWEIIWRRLTEAALAEDDWAGLDRALARRRRRLVLVIDDLDRVVDTDVDGELAAIVKQHEMIHVIAMMRQPRPIHLEAVQVDGPVLHCDDLRLLASDTARIGAAIGQELDGDTAEEITRQLRGWPALVRIALAEPVKVADGVVQVDQGLVDRFIRLLLSDLPSHATRRALQILAVPEILPQELALHLVGRVTLEQMTAFLDDLGLSISELGTPRRGPDPIRSAAASTLVEDDPVIFQEVSRESAVWFAARDEVAPALRHAMAAHEWELVGELLERGWAQLLADHSVLVRDAIEQVPDEIVSTSARLLVARDYILNIATEARARHAYVSGLLLPGGAELARSRRRLSLQEVLKLQSSGHYDVTSTLVEHRDLSTAIAQSGWSSSMVQAVPGLLQEWAVALLLDSPGVRATYAFCEAATWAEHVGDDAAYQDAAAGAALSHTVVGYPTAATRWIEHLHQLEPHPDARFAAAIVPMAETIVRHQRYGVTEVSVEDGTMPDDVADLEVLVICLRADTLIRTGRAREGLRLLERYRLRHSDRSQVGLVEYYLVRFLTEGYLAAGQVERARRLLLDIDPTGVRHPVMAALVAFQSGEYEQALDVVERDDTSPQTVLMMSLLRACAALRLERAGTAGDNFQTAISTATQTDLLRPLLLLPRADLRALAEGDQQALELLSRLPDTDVLPEPLEGSGLSPREQEVLEVVATGASFAAVARRLFVSPNTVKSQMRDIYRKLGVRGRDQAVERARELGVLRR